MNTLCNANKQANVNAPEVKDLNPRTYINTGRRI